jgi:hypothetical protein
MFLVNYVLLVKCLCLQLLAVQLNILIKIMRNYEVRQILCSLVGDEKGASMYWYNTSVGPDMDGIDY